MNRVFGSERMIVSEVPGTTRDPIDTAIELDGQPLVLVDTAGIRRRGSIERGIERYSVLRSMKAIDSADVAVVMTDATEGYTAQDAHVVGYVLEAHKGIVLVLNKWDAVEKDEFTADKWLKRLRREAPYLVWADIVFASALTGQRVERILREALRVAEERYRRVPTGELNRARHGRRARPSAVARPQPAAEDPVRDPGRRGAADVRHLRQRSRRSSTSATSATSRTRSARSSGSWARRSGSILRQRESEEARAALSAHEATPHAQGRTPARWLGPR